MRKLEQKKSVPIQVLNRPDPAQLWKSEEIWCSQGGIREHYAKQNKSIRERQLSYDLTDTRNLRSKTEDHRGGEGKK